MKIGYMVSAYPARSHTFIRREIEELEKKGFSVQRYSQRRYDKSEILNDLEAEEYQCTWSVFPMPFMALLLAHGMGLVTGIRRYFSVFAWALSRRPPGTMGALYAGIYFAQAIYLARQIRADNVAMLHIHFVNSGGYVGAIAAEFLQIPWGVSVHGRSDFDFPGVHALRWVLKDAYFLRCVSSFGASQAMRQCEPVYWDKIFVCYCGLPDQLMSCVKPRRCSSEPITVLSVGRLSAEKGQFLLLKAAASLKSSGYSFKLVIVGDGPDRTQLEHAAQQMNVDDICDFVGTVDEANVMSEMAAAHVFICPSLMEGLPQVLMEAMAVKLPVVAPYLAGIPELITHLETGMLYPTGDWEKMAKAIGRLLNDNALASRCADAGYQVLTQDFVLSQTIEPLAQRIQAIDDNKRNKL